MAAAVGQHVHRAAGADGHDRDLPDQLADGLALGQVGRLHQVVPAGLEQVRDVLGVIRADGQAEGDMPPSSPLTETAARPTRRRRRPRLSCGPRTARDAPYRPTATAFAAMACTTPDPHLLLVLLGPVRRARRGGRDRPLRGPTAASSRAASSWPASSPRRPLTATLRPRPEPAAGCSGMAKPGAVQHIADPGPAGPAGRRAARPAQRVETGGMLETVDQPHARPGARRP